MDIENIKIESLKPYKKNARVHPQKQVDILAKNIEKFGFTTPVLIDESNNIIAGHGRVLAMKQLNKKEVPCVRIEGLTKKEIATLRLADNQIASMGSFDMNLVMEELELLPTELLDLTGFDKDIEIDFAKIESNEDRQVKDKDINITCPLCEGNFTYKL